MALTTTRRDAAQAALARAVECLLAQQSAAGWWSGEPETNSSIDAQDLLLRQFLGIRTARETDASANRIRSRQQPDGTWSLYFGGPPHRSTTVETYLALRLAGDPADAPHMAKAAAYIRSAGGIQASVWVAMFGLRSWDDVPAIPPELIYLPAWVPFNIYDWAVWTRLLLVPLAIIGSLRPVRRLPFDVPELRSERPRHRAHRLVSAASLGTGLDRMLHGYDRRPIARVRTAARRRCSDWLLARQAGDGSWDGSSTHTTLALIALDLIGYGLDHPVMKRGLAALDRFAAWEPCAEGLSRRVDVTHSPHWDTAHAMVALTRAGLPSNHASLVRAAEWMVGQEVRCPGDWQVRRPHGEPGGWTFQFNNEPHPDTDDTAAAVLALRGIAVHDADLAEQALGRGVAWLRTMQSRDGGWAAFDADNTRSMCNRLAFVGFGGAIDPPSADVTAHVIKALCQEGRAGSSEVRRGVAWLLDAQEPDGSWIGRWGVNHVYGTGLVLQALAAAAISPDRPPVKRAVAWLEHHQNQDGGWGEDPGSYTDPALRGRGISTPSQTAWALLGLLAVRPNGSAVVDRGIDWLVGRQRPDGNWDEPQFTGTMFPEHMCVRYDLYRLVFPIGALGRYARA